MSFVSAALVAMAYGPVNPTFGFILGSVSLALSPVYRFVAGRLRRNGNEVMSRRLMRGSLGLYALGGFFLIQASRGL